jgi:hypothetical protein
MVLDSKRDINAPPVPIIALNKMSPLIELGEIGIPKTEDNIDIVIFNVKITKIFVKRNKNTLFMIAIAMPPFTNLV